MYHILLKQGHSLTQASVFTETADKANNSGRV